MEDIYGRKIGYLRMSVTDLCNYRCKYCVPEEGVEKKSHDDMLTIEEMIFLAGEAAKLGVQKVRITGGEPLVRRGILKLVDAIGKMPFKDLAMTTNASLLKGYAKELKQGGLKRINISLDTLNEAKFKEITRGGRLSDVLSGIAAAREEGFYIKINTVLMKGFNDDEIEALADFAATGIVDQLRFIELMTIGQSASWARSMYLPNDIVIERLGLTPLKEEGDFASAAALYKTEKGGIVGLINPISHKFCDSCNRLRVTADGKLRPCLLSDLEFDAKKVIRESPSGVQDILKLAVLNKPQMHQLGNQDETQPQKRNMVRIGG